jgi:hypothetical protein
VSSPATVGPGATGIREGSPTRPRSNLVPHAEPLQALWLRSSLLTAAQCRVSARPARIRGRSECVASRLRASRWTTSRSPASRSCPGVLHRHGGRSDPASPRCLSRFRFRNRLKGATRRHQGRPMCPWRRIGAHAVASPGYWVRSRVARRSSVGGPPVSSESSRLDQRACLSSGASVSSAPAERPASRRRERLERGLGTHAAVRRFHWR